MKASRIKTCDSLLQHALEAHGRAPPSAQKRGEMRLKIWARHKDYIRLHTIRQQKWLRRFRREPIVW